jgi:hypothetical protein
MTGTYTERAFDHRPLPRDRGLHRGSRRDHAHFPRAPMHEVHALLRGWMEAAGMSVHVDAIGNLRGLWPGAANDAPRLLIGSHLDTVPNAGAFDGILGVVLGVASLKSLRGENIFPLPSRSSASPKKKACASASLPRQPRCCLASSMRKTCSAQRSQRHQR